LSELEDLYLKNVNGIPSSFENLTNLTDATFSGGKIDQIDALLNNLKIESLAVMRVGLSKLPDDIGKLTRLKKFSIGGNNVSSLPQSITQLKDLETLSFGSNNFTSFPEEILQLKNLQAIHLNNNQIPFIIPGVSELPNLTYMHVKGNSMKKNKEYKKLKKKLKKFVEDDK